MKFFNKSKKALAKIFALSMSLALVFTVGCGDNGGGEGTREEKENAAHNEFIEELGGTSDTFKGSISLPKYDNVDTAVSDSLKYCVADENASVVNSTKLADLNDTEIANLGIPEDSKEGIIGAEKYEVEYTTEAAATMSTAANSNKKFIVFIVKYEDNRLAYFNPCPTTGETITYNYYASVFQHDKYENCTMTQTLTQTMTMSQTTNGQTQEYSYNASLTMTIKYDDGKMYAEGTSTLSGSMIDAGLVYVYDEYGKPITATAGTQTFKMYYDGNQRLTKQEKDGTPLLPNGAVTNESGWMTNVYLQIAKWNDVVMVEDITPFYDEYLDHTYFTKTDYGFEVADENAEQYMNEALASALKLVANYLDNMNTDMIAKYYVSNGVLSGMRQDVIMDMSASANGVTMSVGTTIISETSVKDYGTTVVTNPMEVAE